MLVSNNTIFSSTNAADGAWRNVSNFTQFSLQVNNVEGTVWIEASNDPAVMTDGASSLAAPAVPTATITNIALTSNVLTVTATNTFAAGQQVVFSGVGTNTFLNGQMVTIATASGANFTAAFTHANVSSGADTGTVTFFPLSQVAYGAQTGQGTAFVKLTYVTAAGETLAGTEVSLALSDGNMLVIASPGSLWLSYWLECVCR
jgi:hypothetical protein